MAKEMYIRYYGSFKLKFGDNCTVTCKYCTCFKEDFDFKNLSRDSCWETSKTRI